MESINDDGQWIVLMGFIISVALFFLAIIVNQSVTVGQTTSEAVLEFPKNEIQEVREVTLDLSREGYLGAVHSSDSTYRDLELLTMDRMNAIVSYNTTPDKHQDIYYKYDEIEIHFNNGVTYYNETYYLPEKI